MNIYSDLFVFCIRLTILFLIPFHCVTLTRLEKEVRILSADQRNTLLLFKQCKARKGIKKYANRKEMRSRAVGLKVNVVQVLNTTTFEEVRFWKCPTKILSREFIFVK